MHKEKDVHLNEDRIRYTDKNAIQSMAILNNLGLIMIRLCYAVLHQQSLGYSKLYVTNDPIKAFNTLLGMISSEEIMFQVKNEIKKKTK